LESSPNFLRLVALLAITETSDHRRASKNPLQGHQNVLRRLAFRAKLVANEANWI